MDIKDNCDCLNCHLKEKWRACYQASEEMIQNHPDVYRQILMTLDRIISRPLDIDEYWDTAVSLSGLLEKMGQETIFYYYFFEQINPYLQGNARYLRHLCLDLREQIDALNRWRREKRRLRLVETTDRRD